MTSCELPSLLSQLTGSTVSFVHLGNLGWVLDYFFVGNLDQIMVIQVPQPLMPKLTIINCHLVALDLWF
jgi:hypothetical protein